MALGCSVEFDSFSLPFQPLVSLRPYASVSTLSCSYQLEGVRWLLQNCLSGIASGGLLCDEMGLGKTAQTAVALACLPENTSSCVVCPKSLVLNWVHEIQKFVPDDRLHVVPCLLLLPFTVGSSRQAAVGAVT